MIFHSDKQLRQPRAACTTYRLAGLDIHTELALPELLAGDGTAPAVTIRTGKVPGRIDNIFPLAPGWSAGPAGVLLEVPGIARFLIRNGAEIVVDAPQTSEPSQVRLYLLGSAFGALCHQRGLLPLHAAAMASPSGVCAFTGPSGAGKSTLLSFLARRGYPMVADDVCVISFDGSQPPVALPAHPQIKLWADAVHAADLHASTTARVDPRRDKFYVALDHGMHFCSEPRPLQRLYLLADGVDASEPVITPLSRAQALAELTRNTYRAFLLDPMGQWTRHFSTCARLVQHIDVYRLSRPRGLDRMPAVTDRLERHFNE